MKKIFLFFIFSLVCYASKVSVDNIKIYIVYSFKYNDKIVEKFYLKKENAVKYCERFKDNHDYQVEEVTITE